MIYSLSKAARRTLAVSLLLAVIAAAAAFIISPVWSHIADLNDRIEQSRMMVGRLASATSGDGTRNKIAQRTEAAQKAGLFIEGESESIKVSALQSKLAEIVAGQGVKLRSARNLAGRERNDLRLIGIQLQMAVSVDRLQKIMFEIERHKPVFIIEYIHVTPMDASRVADGGQTGQLDARLDVFAIEAKQKG